MGPLCCSCDYRDFTVQEISISSLNRLPFPLNASFTSTCSLQEHTIQQTRFSSISNTNVSLCLIVSSFQGGRFPFITRIFDMVSHRARHGESLLLPVSLQLPLQQPLKLLHDHCSLPLRDQSRREMS